jgi:transposase
MAPRRQFSSEFKSKLVLDVLSGRRTAADVCREYQLKDDMFSRWKAQFLANALKLIEREHLADPAEARIAELERVIGRLTLELEVAKKAFRLVDGRSSKNAR